jgi:hypothetical protein
MTQLDERIQILASSQLEGFTANQDKFLKEILTQELENLRPTEIDEVYGRITENVMGPLLNGFANAIDLYERTLQESLQIAIDAEL